MLVDKPLRDVLAAFASSDPTPGGGSASALASAVGSSLLTMIAGLPKTRSNTDEDRAALAAAAAALTGVRQQLIDAIDADTAAYDQVVAAYKRPKATPEEQQARTAAIQQALRAATDVPLSVMRWSSQVLGEASEIAAHGHRAAASDVGVAVRLLEAGADGARLNVEINLDGVKDEAYRNAVRKEVAALASEIARAVDAAGELIAG